MSLLTIPSSALPISVAFAALIASTHGLGEDAQVVVGYTSLSMTVSAEQCDTSGILFMANVALFIMHRRLMRSTNKIIANPPKNDVSRRPSYTLQPQMLDLDLVDPIENNRVEHAITTFEDLVNNLQSAYEEDDDGSRPRRSTLRQVSDLELSRLATPASEAMSADDSLNETRSDDDIDDAAGFAGRHARLDSASPDLDSSHIPAHDSRLDTPLEPSASAILNSRQHYSMTGQTPGLSPHPVNSNCAQRLNLEPYAMAGFANMQFSSLPVTSPAPNMVMVTPPQNTIPYSGEALSLVSPRSESSPSQMNTLP
ncbi:uncharacterized protein MONBRDRAFT_30461 [Monosiga brevicollis MX1]|uniref:Uncharacterized protein n=1 Tax=Monosiga brevicollis TaxID=81824 RepID=A9VE07_MONBE|nr:uncharacterized protein MONBRDRAFT_30461 [Monosiga brevicollis MX1]EDQ84242.1 predicted protein [Monosiga brevicollis MX1]|eukprot:XP_001750966.1 hypothetical protein [Monosiga brevicollis MX1]